MGGGRGVGGGACGVCRAASSLTCGGCGVMYYCGKDHQRRDWAQHRALCRPYKEVVDPKLGRCVYGGDERVMSNCKLVIGRGDVCFCECGVSEGMKCVRECVGE